MYNITKQTSHGILDDQTHRRSQSQQPQQRQQRQAIFSFEDEVNVDTEHISRRTLISAIV